MLLYIDHATLFTPDKRLDDRCLLIEDGRIAAIYPAVASRAPASATVIDATGLLVAPGFIDLQLNGAFGHDFTQAPETIWPVAAGLPRYGVTASLPTIITSPLATVTRAQAVLTAGPPAEWRGSTPLGLHCEGPFLNPKKKGAHNPLHLRQPAVGDVAAWSPAQQVRLVTSAPELPGALDVVRALVGRGVVVSAGHSMATYAEAQAGFEAGIAYGTHLFNAMSTLEHREPGLPGALLTTPDLVVGIIPDGVHTHPAVVALAWACTGPHRLNVVTDAMAALGMPPGVYMLADQAVTVTAREARLPSGTLAGSVLAIDAALRQLIHFTGCSLPDALCTMTLTPARLLGLEHERGQIIPGAVADLVFLTPELEVVKTIVNGEVLFEQEKIVDMKEEAVTLEQSHLYQEINEQPDVLRSLIARERSVIKKLAAAIQGRQIEYVVIAARGTSDNAGRYAQYVLGSINRYVVALATPSLFSIYKQPPRFGNALVIGISQSGKSPDIVSVLAEARRQGALTAAITNFPDSDLGRQTEHIINLRTGEEKSIAATKTYTASLAAIAALSAELCQKRDMWDALERLPDMVTEILKMSPEIARLAERYRYVRDCVVMGRGYNYATAFELALKLKEVTYTIAEPYSSADFMHGPLALIEQGFPALVVAPTGVVLPEMQEFIRTLNEREAEVIAISDDPATLDLARVRMPLPTGVPEWLSPVTAIVPGQLFALHLAVVRDFDPDHPRGLRKVTETR